MKQCCFPKQYLFVPVSETDCLDSGFVENKQFNLKWTDPARMKHIHVKEKQLMVTVRTPGNLVLLCSKSQQSRKPGKANLHSLKCGGATTVIKYQISPEISEF